MNTQINSLRGSARTVINSDRKRTAAKHALTLLENRHVKTALAVSRSFGLNYLDIVMVSESMGNSERLAKAHGLFLLGLSSLDSLEAAAA